MATKKDYIIPYVGLESGNHTFEFPIGREFIENEKIDDVKSLSLTVRLEVNKTANLFTIGLYITGTISTKCDRCLEWMDLPIDFDSEFYVKTGIEKESESEFDDDEDILYVKEGESHLDLYQYIYESVVLSIPLKKAHEDDQEGKPTCNSEVMRILHRNNKENEKNKSHDPRWDVLKNLNLE